MRNIFLVNRGDRPGNVRDDLAAFHTAGMCAASAQLSLHQSRVRTGMFNLIPHNFLAEPRCIHLCVCVHGSSNSSCRVRSFFLRKRVLSWQLEGSEGIVDFFEARRTWLGNKLYLSR